IRRRAGRQTEPVATGRPEGSRRQPVRHVARTGQERGPYRGLPHSRDRYRRSDQRPPATGSRAQMIVPQPVLDRLKDAVGAKGFSTDQKDIAPYLEEWRSRYAGHTPLLLKPATTAEVSAILRIAHETGAPIVPQGG